MAAKLVEVAWVVVEKIPERWVMVEEALFARRPPKRVARLETDRVLERVAAPEAERVVRLVGPKVAAMFVASSFPPERVRPWDDETPAVEMPPKKVEVAMLCEVIPFET